MDDLHALWKSIYPMFLAVIPPSLLVMVGRLAYWAHVQKRVPSWKETAQEGFIIIFMGAIAGGAAERLGLSGSEIGAFSAACGFFGPRTLSVLLNAILKKAGLSPVDICDLDSGVSRLDPKEIRKAIDREMKK